MKRSSIRANALCLNARPLRHACGRVCVRALVCVFVFLFACVRAHALEGTHAIARLQRSQAPSPCVLPPRLHLTHLPPAPLRLAAAFRNGFPNPTPVVV